MKGYELVEALNQILKALILNAPIVLVTITVSILIIGLLDKLGYIKQPKNKKGK